MRLDDIGFYTLTDERARSASHTSPLSRCEYILTSRCNFKCPYCRRTSGEDASYGAVSDTITQWAKDGLRAIRFSGGEPTLYQGLDYLCMWARDQGIERIAVSTNGSAKPELYDRLLTTGVNDFSISLDACCAEDGDRMAGGVKGAFKTIISNIRWLSERTYVTVGVVLTEANIDKTEDIISFASSLGVADIRIIPAAQNGDRFRAVRVHHTVLATHPILNYRIQNIKAGQPVRGLRRSDAFRCGLVLDDMAVNQERHYPCIIYLREGGSAIGRVNADMRNERREWYECHDIHSDPICKANCLDVCREYNNKYAAYHATD